MDFESHSGLELDARRGTGCGISATHPKGSQPAQGFAYLLQLFHWLLCLPADGLKRLMAGLMHLFPQLTSKGFEKVEICWYNDTPTGDFIFDFHSEHKERVHCYWRKRPVSEPSKGRTFREDPN